MNRNFSWIQIFGFENTWVINTHLEDIEKTDINN